MTFEQYWQQNWMPTGQPAIFDNAMREIAEKSWNACVEASALAAEDALLTGNDHGQRASCAVAIRTLKS